MRGGHVREDAVRAHGPAAGSGRAHGGAAASEVGHPGREPVPVHDARPDGRAVPLREVQGRVVPEEGDHAAGGGAHQLQEGRHQGLHHQLHLLRRQAHDPRSPALRRRHQRQRGDRPHEHQGRGSRRGHCVTPSLPHHSLSS